jgi:hypothetical protein
MVKAGLRRIFGRMASSTDTTAPSVVRSFVEASPGYYDLC